MQVRFADTGDLAATLIEEGDNSPADVYFAQEPGAIGALARAGCWRRCRTTSSTGSRRSTGTRRGDGSASPGAPG